MQKNVGLVAVIQYTRMTLCIGAILLIPHGLSAQQGLLTSTTSPGSVFLFVQRAPSHFPGVESKEFLKNVVDDLSGYLKSKNVVVARDDLGGRSFSESEMPFSTVQNIARDVGAKYLLYVLVERPVTKWLKITIRCYDASGQELWVAESSPSSWWALTGGQGVRATLRDLHKKLDKRVAGLPVSTATGTGPS